MKAGDRIYHVYGHRLYLCTIEKVCDKTIFVKTDGSLNRATRVLIKRLNVDCGLYGGGLYTFDKDKVRERLDKSKAAQIKHHEECMLSLSNSYKALEA